MVNLVGPNEDIICITTVISALQRSALIYNSLGVMKTNQFKMLSFSLLTPDHLVLRKTFCYNRGIYLIYLVQNFKEWNLIISLFWFFNCQQQRFSHLFFFFCSTLCGLNVWRWANSSSNEIKADENTANDTVYHQILTTTQLA